MNDIKRVIPLSAYLALGYLALVLLLIFLEVRVVGSEFSRIGFYALTGLYSVTTVWIYWRRMDSKPLALLSGAVVSACMFAVAIVIGVNAKFWMGGSL
jgi:hypothetical protein